MKISDGEKTTEPEEQINRQQWCDNKCNLNILLDIVAIFHRLMCVVFIADSDFIGKQRNYVFTANYNVMQYAEEDNLFIDDFVSVNIDLITFLDWHIHQVPLVQANSR